MHHAGLAGPGKIPFTRSLGSALLLAASLACSSDRPSSPEIVATFTVDSGTSDRLDTPVSASLEVNSTWLN